MPLRSIIEFEINDEPFKDFVALFDRYRTALKQTPGDWARASEAIDPLAAQFSSMTAAMLAQSELIHRLEAEERQLGRTTGSTATAWHSVAQGARSVHGYVSDTTRMLLRWGGIGGLFGGLVGFGGLWGLEHLTQSASTLRTQSMGANVSPAQLLAARVNYGQFFNAQGALGNIAGLQSSLGGQVPFNVLGIPEAYTASPASALDQVVGAVHNLYKSTPAGQRQNMPWYQQARQIFGDEGIRTIGNMSDEEIAAQRRSNQKDAASNFGLKPGTVQAAQHLQMQLERVGYTLEFTFLAALDKVFPKFEDLSKSVGDSIASFLKGPGFANLVDVAGEALEGLDKWISGPNFQADLKTFATDVGAVAKGLETALKWLGLIPQPTLGWGDKKALYNTFHHPHLGPIEVFPRGDPRIPPGSAMVPGGPKPGSLPSWMNPGNWFGSANADRSAFDASLAKFAPGDPDTLAAASIIGWRESRDKNVRNSKYNVWGHDANGIPLGYTASGYWQMLASNWHSYGAGLVDFAKYPEAVDAPKGLQFQVFQRMYKKEGYRPWDSAHGGSITSDGNFHAEHSAKLASYRAAANMGAAAGAASYANVKVGVKVTNQTGQNVGVSASQLGVGPQ